MYDGFDSHTVHQFLIMNSLNEYGDYWFDKANTTHRHWWYDWVVSNKNLEEYIKSKYKKYKNRYGKQIRAKKAKKVG